MNKRTKLIVGGAVGLIALVAIIVSIVLVTKSSDEVAEEDWSQLSPRERAYKILDRMPVIDGHNDFPWNLRGFLLNNLTQVDFNSHLNETEPWASSANSHTDIPRLREGRVGAQFWVAFVSCASQYKDAVEQTIEQIDVIKRLASQYRDHLQFATSVADIESAIRNKKVASLIGIEGGHSIQSSFGILRMTYDLGVRYMTITHSCSTPWADSSVVDEQNASAVAVHNGLSPYGIKVIHEMNRLGMLIDLSHVSKASMIAALNSSKAPVIFSHSSAYSLCNHARNVQDDVLALIKQKNSIIMVNFYSVFIQCDPTKRATLQDVLQHIDHIRNITGPDHIGLGGDYDGVDSVPLGLEDVSKYPALIEALIETGRWSNEDLEKLTGRNLLRVFREAEKVRDELRQTDPEPIQDIMTREDYIDAGGYLDCATAKLPGDSKAGGTRQIRTISEFPEL